ncbi:S-layer homology domain-containing protein [Paenibacillus sp. S-38]|uniref:S-layer homology domain-containing protein n=1 Tax=Paenibacillus sp. S-38 TaxID=3416710 RepID=UPI003CF969DA
MRKCNGMLAAVLVVTTALGSLTGGGPLRSLPEARAYAADGGFTDADQAASWAQEAILEMRRLGIMSGYPDGGFHPLDRLTRQEFAAVLAVSMGLPLDQAARSSFADVPAEGWSVPYIEAVREMGYMEGDGGGVFRPEAPITREEIAAILVRASGVEAGGLSSRLPYADRDQISAWAKDAVQYLYESGVMSGDGTAFAPRRHALRQEIAVVLAKALPLLKEAPPAELTALKEGKAVLNGTEYRVPQELAGLLSEANADVLQNAKIRFEARDGMLTRITYLELTAAGQPAGAGEAEFSGNRVLDGGGARIDGKVKAAADYLTLNNLTVTGELEIGRELQHDFLSSGLTVLGRTVVNGGDSNTVVFDRAVLGAVDIGKADVRVKTVGETTVGSMALQANAVVEAAAGVVIPKLTLEAGAQKVKLEAEVTLLEWTGRSGTAVSGGGAVAAVHAAGQGLLELDLPGGIGTVEVRGAGGRISVKEGTRIGQLIVPAGKTPSDVVENYDQAKGRIGTGSASSTPVGGGGGGGGGGKGKNSGSGTGGSGTGSGTGTGTDTGTGTEAGTDTGGDQGTGTDTDTGAEPDQGTDTGSDTGTDGGDSSSGGTGGPAANEAPAVRPAVERVLHLAQSGGITLLPSDLAEDREGDALAFVPGTVQSSVYEAVYTKLELGSLVIQPRSIGSAMVTVSITDGPHTTAAAVPVRIVMDELLTAALLSGASFPAGGVDQPAVIRLQHLSESGAEAGAFTGLTVSAQGMLLVQGQHYLLDELTGEVTLTPDFLNSLEEGFVPLSFTLGGLTAGAVLEVRPAAGSLTAQAVYGAVLREADAAVEALFTLTKSEGSGQPSVPGDLSSASIRLGDRGLVQGRDFAPGMEPGEVLILPAFLNTLAAGKHTLTLKLNGLTAPLPLEVLPLEEEVRLALSYINGAANAAEMREALESAGLWLELTPYYSLSDARQTQVAEEVLLGRGSGFTGRWAVQDLLDLTVERLQLEGDEAGAILAVNEAGTPEEMLSALMSPLLHLDNEYYTYMEDYELLIIGKYLIDQVAQNGAYTTQSAIQYDFDAIIYMILEDWDAIIEDASALEPMFAAGDRNDSVTQDLILPAAAPVYGAAVSWISSVPAVITAEGRVTRPVSDTQVTLTAHLTNRYEKFDLNFTLTVKGTGGAFAAAFKAPIAAPSGKASLLEAAKLRFVRP